MGKQGSSIVVLVISCLLLLAVDVYGRKLGPKSVDEEDISFLRGGKEQVVQLKLYVHDLRVGSANPTVYEVASASITPTSPTGFGTIDVVDDLVTTGPSINSKAIARIQGLTTSADLTVNAVALNLNFYFTAGRFNGSTISIVGRNQVANPQRELPVVGGTGAFRFARGYAIQTSVSYDSATSYAVMEFNIYTTYNPRYNNEQNIAQI